MSKIVPLWCELQMHVIPFSFKDNSAIYIDNEIIVGPMGPKFSLGRSAAAVGPNQLSKHSEGQKQMF